MKGNKVGYKFNNTRRCFPPPDTVNTHYYVRITVINLLHIRTHLCIYIYIPDKMLIVFVNIQYSTQSRKKSELYVINKTNKIIQTLEVSAVNLCRVTKREILIIPLTYYIYTHIDIVIITPI